MKERIKFKPNIQGLTNSFRALRSIRSFNSLTGPEIAERHGDKIRGSFGEWGEATPVLICARDELHDLPKLLYALSQQTESVHPIVVDNNSSDGTGDIARCLGVQAIQESEKGLINALRRGFSFFAGLNSPPSCILHTDSDCYPVSTWAQHLIKRGDRLERADGGQLFGPVVFYGSAARDTFRTIVALTIDLKLGLRGFIRPKGPNGIILLDSEKEILTRLQELDSRCVTGTDQLVNDLIFELGGISAFDLSPQGLVFAKGDRYPSIRSIFATFINPDYRSILYADWHKGVAGGFNYRSKHNPRKRL